MWKNMRMTHLVSSRDGLWIFDQERAHFTKVLDGKFFGIAGEYIFGYNGEQYSRNNGGFIMSLKDGSILAEGLDNGCHQMTIWRDHMYIVETYIQRLVKIPLDGRPAEYLHPWPKSKILKYGKKNSEYLHVNAMTVQDDRFFFMCPYLGRSGEPRTSKIQVWSPLDWTLLDEYELDRMFCHDLIIVGHEIFFCDASGTVCSLNLVTRIVSTIHGINAPKDQRIMCRGLSIGPDEKFITAVSWEGFSALFSKDAVYKNHFPIAPTFITRIDGKDYNNIRKSYITTRLAKDIPFFADKLEYFNKLFEIREGLNEMTSDRNPPKDMNEFLGPVFDTLLDASESYINGKTQFIIEPSSEFIGNDEYLQSGKIYYYPKDHGMGWHTNRTQFEGDKDFHYRHYMVKTTGGTFFFYRHKISKKIHAVHDIDSSVNIFSIQPDPDYLWHAIGSVRGDRMSVGFKKKSL